MAHRQVKVEGPPPGIQPEVVPCRLPIKDVVKNEEQFSIYVQALISLQEQPWDASDQLSYWQLASLHGLPTVDSSGNPYQWDTVKKNGFWCAHSRPTFPTWHRPYVSLYEQALVNTAIYIVNSHPNPVPNRTVWHNAAQELRAPYWDWAIDEYPPDEVIAKSELTILGLDGKKHTVKNPLYSYTYQTGAIKIENSPKTVRHPNSAGETDLEAVRKALRGTFKPARGDTMRETIFKLHRDAKTWEVVSNEGGTSDDIKFRSGLEQPHGQIHVALGGAGAMGSVPTAGYDPAFMLHHAQVDRQLAIWQTYHYDQWIPTDPGLIPLTPFWDGSQEFNSSGIRDFQIFRYRYPEFVDIPNDKVEASKFMWNKIVHLYGPEPTSQPTADVAASLLDWFAHLRVPIKSIRESFTCYFFAGPAPQNPRNWYGADNLIGTYAKFAGSDPAQCANCRSLIADGIESHAVVTLSPALKVAQKYGQSETQIEQYLRDKLEWRLLRIDGTEIKPSEIEGLVISVLTQKLRRPRGGEGHFPAFPDPDETPVYHNVTGGKPGGRPDA
jgi:tyrosinase